MQYFDHAIGSLWSGTGRGRSVLGEWASEILTVTLPKLVEQAFFYSACDPKVVKAHLDSVEDQAAARAQVRPIRRVIAMARA